MGIEKLPFPLKLLIICGFLPSRGMLSCCFRGRRLILKYCFVFVILHKTGQPLIIIVMEICKAPTLPLKALNKHTHIMYIEMENVIRKKKKKKRMLHRQVFKHNYAKAGQTASLKRTKCIPLQTDYIT